MEHCRGCGGGFGTAQLPVCTLALTLPNHTTISMCLSFLIWSMGTMFSSQASMRITWAGSAQCSLCHPLMPGATQCWPGCPMLSSHQWWTVWGKVVKGWHGTATAEGPVLSAIHLALLPLSLILVPALDWSKATSKSTTMRVNVPFSGPGKRRSRRKKGTEIPQGGLGNRRGAPETLMNTFIYSINNSEHFWALY